MIHFELLTLVGLAIVIALLIRTERILKTTLTLRERQTIEAKVRDFMPTLWVDPEFRDNLVHWYILATGPYNKVREKDWHWATIVQNLSTIHGQISPDEIERLNNLSTEFSHEAELSHLLTDLEVRYLLFRAWNSHFVLIGMITPNDILSFENELSTIRKRYLPHIERR